MGPTHRLAIDLGTCHTVAVVRRGDEAPRSLLFDGSPLLSSGVYADVQGALSVGRDAERMSQLDPSRFEPFPKRRVDEGSVLLGDTETPVVELLAALLRRVAGESLQSGVNPIGATVLTCPADWGGQRRGILLAAARAAHLGPVELVDEPIAAATYCLRVLGRQIAPMQCLTVFDFGGGTLDVSVVRREADGLLVLAVGGLDDLGGVDVDAALVGHLGQLINLRVPEIWRRLSHPVGPGAQRDRRALWNEVRAAKEMLSRASSSPVHVPGTEEALHLTREELDRVAGPLVDRAVDETRRMLERAGVGTASTAEGHRLAGIFLVGGSSRIPLVASRLHARFNVAPTVPEQPELPVAFGALLAARPPATTALHRAGPRFQYPGGMPVSGPPLPGAPTSPVGSYPAASVSAGAPIAASTSFPPVQIAPPGRAFAPNPAAPPGWADPPGPRPGTAGPGERADRPGRPPFEPADRPAHRPPDRPKRKATRWVVLGVVAALLVGCGYGGYRAVKGGVSWFHDATAKVGGGGTGNGGGNGGGAALTKLGEVALPTDGGVAVAAGTGTTSTGTAAQGGGSVYTAAVGGGKTTVSALDATGMKARWSTDLQVEAEKVKLTVTGSLVVLDADSATTHAGKDVRAVLDAKTGAKKWLAAHDTQRDVAFLGNDVIVETSQPKDTVERVDLLTGKVRWTHDANQFSITPGHQWSGPVLQNGVPAGSGTRVPGYWVVEGQSTINFHEQLSVDPSRLVVLSNDDGKGAVLDAASGRPKVSGALPLDDEWWAAFNGLAVGLLTDEASPGKPVIAGYSLDSLKRLWSYALPAGADVARIKPCGPTLVCVQASVTDSKEKVFALSLADGKPAWTNVADSGDGQNWYVVGTALVFGRDSFGAVGGDDPAALNPADGKVRLSFKAGVVSPTIVAADGTHVLLNGVKPDGSAKTTWQVTLVDLSTGRRSAAIDVSVGDQPKQTFIAGDLVVGLSSDNHVRAWRIPK